MATKYWYQVELAAEDDMTGWVLLTAKEAAAVAKATDQRNWRNISGGGWCGNFFIDLSSKKASLDNEADELTYLHMEQQEQM